MIKAIKNFFFPSREYRYAKLYKRMKEKEVFPPQITMAARNELRKIRATNINNVSVALQAAGFIIPFISFIPKIVAYYKEVALTGDYNKPMPEDLVTPILLAAIALVLGYTWKVRAEVTLMTIEDDKARPSGASPEA